MVNFIIKRILIALLVVFLVSVFVFSVMHLLPGDPVRLAMGYEAAESDVQRVREELNLTRPLGEQYFLWIIGLFKGDFGLSIVFDRPVADLLHERLPRTVSLGIPAMIIAVIVGVGFGIISALERGKWIDQVITLIATLGVGTPQFWIGIVGIYIFAIGLKLLPMQGFTAPSQDFPLYLKKAVMPVFCMCIVMLASLARQTRSNMLEVINQDYIRTARANGIPMYKIIFKHALKNALIPVITIIGMQLRVVIGGSLLVEQVFSIAGIGTMLTHAISNRDYFVVQSCVLIISLFTVAANMIVDILYGVIDPRIRMARR
ncbi:MAG: ABC transporter permease [Anaerolineales bacterium]|jgi:peptide/nickel transport system permease protein